MYCVTCVKGYLYRKKQFRLVSRCKNLQLVIVVTMCHKSACELSLLSKCALIRKKFGPKSSILRGCYGANLDSIWLIFEIFNFWLFLAFGCIFDKVHLFSASKKTHTYDIYIFIFVLVYILWRNSTQNLGKIPYVRWEKVCLLIPFNLFLKMLFKGETFQPIKWIVEGLTKPCRGNPLVQRGS